MLERTNRWALPLQVSAASIAAERERQRRRQRPTVGVKGPPFLQVSVQREADGVAQAGPMSPTALGRVCPSCSEESAF